MESINICCSYGCSQFKNGLIDCLKMFVNVYKCILPNIGFLSLTMWGCVGMMTWLGALGKSPSGGGEFASISSYHGTSISHIMMIVILTYDDHHHTLKKHKISNIQLLEWAIPPALLHVKKKNASSRKVRQSELETLLYWWNHYQSYISHISVIYIIYIW